MKNIKITVKAIAPKQLQADLLAIPTFESKKVIDDLNIKIDEKTRSALKSLATSEDFKGQKNQNMSFYPSSKNGLRQIVLFGLGNSEKFDPSTLRKSAAHIAKACLKKNGKKLAFVVPKLDASFYRYQSSYEEIAQTLVEGALLGTYTFSKYKSNKANTKKPKEIKEIILICDSKSLVTNLKSCAKRAHIFALATSHARDLVNEPPSQLTPTEMAKFCRKLFRENSIKVSTKNKSQIEALKMNAYLAVSKGSSSPPVMIQIDYTPTGKTKDHVILLGKGVTFDSGGLSLKPSKNMETMKDDMAGAAAIIGTMYGISVLKPNVKVTAITLATENMPDGSALKPGDVVKACNGKTIEVLNTDAEGRLTLADGLVYASRLKPKAIIDIATLTGACLVALGSSISAVFSNNEELSQSILDSGKNAGEDFWKMPLHSHYKELLKSPIADLKNIGGPYGGAITAALFLEEFVDEKIPWAHLDIAGPAWSDKESGIHTKGGTGFAVRTLLNFICNR